MRSLDMLELTFQSRYRNYQGNFALVEYEDKFHTPRMSEVIKKEGKMGFKIHYFSTKLAEKIVFQFIEANEDNIKVFSYKGECRGAPTLPARITERNGKCHSIGRGTISQEPFIIAFAIENTANLHGVALHNVKHKVAFHNQTAVALRFQRIVAHIRATLRHLRKTADFFDNQIIVPECGIGRKGVEIADEVLQIPLGSRVYLHLIAVHEPYPLTASIPQRNPRPAPR